MKIVVDTNVLISGTFYPGPSSRILDACMRGEFQIVLSPGMRPLDSRLRGNDDGRQDYRPKLA